MLDLRSAVPQRAVAVLFSSIFTLALISPDRSAQGAGLYQQGDSARTLGMAGASTATGLGPLDALGANPATLGNTKDFTLELNGNLGLADGTFHNRANDHARLGEEGFFGSAAASVKAGPVRFGLGILPQMTLKDQWRYRDTPGGADGATTYGEQTHESEIVLLRTALSASWEITPQLSIGATGGLLYNRNRLNSPYVFQSQPVLRGAKTLLDLNTEGYGWNTSVGLLWKPLKTVSAGLGYTSRAVVKTDGTATGDAGTQFKNLGLGAARSDFAYDAEVTNVFPDQLTAGVAWQVATPLLITAQVDWIHWHNAFDTLPVRLTDGNNADLNGLVGSDRLNDDIPLNWRDQYVFHLAGEYALNKYWKLRAGYSYAQNPVPDHTLTPLTAAIFEHTISVGLGLELGRATFDLGWQYLLPATAHTGQSILAGGEYTNSTITTSVQIIGLTTRLAF